ncbi:RNase P and RNase MRP subunit [Coemansia erecta]|nr:RNase P and RNase MRP subunit [Coemansia sp. RSA 2618]KAJ2822489.1 RNase P and RNase MRP subunit [Coemansia erecta]
MATTARTVSDRRRQVFKHALEKPYTTTWPSASIETQTEILDMLCTALHPLSAHFSETRRISKSRHRRGKKRKQTIEPLKPSTDVDGTQLSAGQTLLKHVVLGINSTTRSLEKQARRTHVSVADDVALVVVCKGDVDTQLCAHFPALAHAARVAKASGEERQSAQLRLLAVGAGAEARLAEAAGQQRVSVIGIRAGVPALDRIIEKACAEVAVPSVPWVGQDGGDSPFYPMAVRELHTSAPILNKRKQGPGATVPNKRKQAAGESVPKAP